MCLKNSQSCTYWGSYQSCDSNCYYCGDNRCECGETQSSCPQDCGYNTPTVDLRSSGSVECGKNATLTWTSTNANACQASGEWSGSKSTSGSEQVGNFTGSRTFTITCTGSGGTAIDSVTLDGSGDDLEVNAGSDKEIESGQTVRLDGSVEGDYDSLHWTCTGGSLSDYDILRPTYRPPFNYGNDYDDDYTCTLTARNECGSDTDSVRVSVNRDISEFNVALIARPKADCVPLKDVDLVATISNYRNDDYDNDYDYDRNFTYYFDCENDGHWDKTVTTDDTSYSAIDLCDYLNGGSYTAKVRVESRGMTAYDTEIVRAESCNIITSGSVSITKTVKNVSRGTDYLGSVTANPGDIISYKIVVVGVSGNSNNVLVSDNMPAGIINIRDLLVNGYTGNGNLASGINLGSLAAGQAKTITYTGTVAYEANFNYGQTTLNNVATATANGSSANSNASVNVYRAAVLGATTISTGIGGSVFAGLGAALLAAIACLMWVSRGQIIGFFKNDPQKSLRGRIAFIKRNGL